MTTKIREEQVEGLVDLAAEVAGLSIASTPFDVRTYGAVVDGVTNDAVAFRATVAAVKAAGGGRILIPTGTMLISTSGYSGANISGILLDFDNVAIVGQGRGKSRILMAAGCNFIPILGQKQGVSDLAPVAISNVSITGLTIEYATTGPASAGTIQLNNVQNSYVSDILIKGNGTTMGGVNVDGLVYAFESSGTFHDVVVDGISKGGVYLALAKNVIGSAEIKNGSGAFNVGCQISGAFDCDLTLDVHDGTGPGIIGFVNSTISATITVVTNQTHFRLDYGLGNAYGSVYAKYLGVLNSTTKCMEPLDVLSVTTADAGVGRLWDIVLNVAPNKTLVVSDPIFADYQPCNNVTIRGASYKNGAEGLTFASAVTGGFCRNVNVLGLNTHDNTSYGINPTSIKNINLIGCVSERNTAGVFAADVGSNSSVQGLCNGLNIVGGRYKDNTLVGIQLSACDNVVIAESVEVSTSNVASYQAAGVQIGGKGVADSKAVTVTGATDLVNCATHGYSAGDPVVFDTTANGITTGTVYYVIASGLTANVFRVSTTFGGSTINITSDGSNVVRPWKRCTGIRIGKFAHWGYTTSHIYHPLGAGDAPTSGLYDFDSGSGSPEGGYFAPIGSYYWDTANGQAYLKSSAGTLATGWVRIFRTDDATTTSTASKLIMRDSNADSFQRNATVSLGVNNPVGGIFYSVLAGSTHLFGDSSSNSFAALNATTLTLVCPQQTWAEAVTPTISIAQRTTDAAIHDITIVGQAPYASATGTNRNSGGIVIQTPVPVAGGTAGAITLKTNATDRIAIDGAGSHVHTAVNWSLTHSGSVGFTAGSASTGILFYNAQANGYFQFSALGAGAITYLYQPALVVGGADQVEAMRFTLLGTGASTVQVATGVTSFTYKQADKTTNSGVGATFTIQAQNETGTTSTGGALTLQSGSGTSVGGAISLIAPNNASIIFTSGTTNTTTYSGTSWTFASTITGPTWTQAKRSGTGTNAGEPFTIRAQAGQNTSTLAGNNGGDIYLAAGVPTTGSETNGSSGAVAIFSGDTPVASFYTTNLANLLEWQFDSGITLPPIITQENNPSNASPTGNTFTIKAQSCPGTTSTGGMLLLASGSGTSTNGAVRIQVGTQPIGDWKFTAGGDTRFVVDSTVPYCVFAANGSGQFLDFQATTGIVYFTAPNITFRDGSAAAVITCVLDSAGASSLAVATGVTSFTLKQSDKTTNSGTGATFTIQAQNETGTTSIGGALALKAGSGTSAHGVLSLQGATVVVNDTTGATAATWTPLSAGATTLQIAAGATSFTLNQAQATSGVGQTTTINAQRGFAGSAGGILKIGGGAGGTSAADLPGATQIDLGTAVANVSAKCSFLVGGSTVLDINQSAASVTYLKSSARMQISGTSLNFTDNSLNPIISYNISTNQINFFKDLNFNGTNYSVSILQLGGTGATAGYILTVAAGQGQGQTGGAANNAGGALLLQGGAAGTGGAGAAATTGPVRISPGASVIIIEATQLTTTQNIVALARKSALTTTQMPTNTGDGVIYIGAAATEPTASPVSGGILYVDGSGNLKFYTSGGNIRTVAAV